MYNVQAFSQDFKPGAEQFVSGTKSRREVFSFNGFNVTGRIVANCAGLGSLISYTGRCITKPKTFTLQFHCI